MNHVKVSNLPKWISELHLKQFFECCGKVSRATIALSDQAPRPLGHGYITFVDDESVQKAIAMDGCRLDGAIIRVSEAATVDAIAEETEV